MCLQGRVTAIGGLDLKIIGGIMAGVTTFLFPTENQKDFDLFLEKYREKDIIKGISFHPISTIQEAFDLVLEPPDTDTKSNVSVKTTKKEKK